MIMQIPNWALDSISNSRLDIFPFAYLIYSRKDTFCSPLRLPYLLTYTF